MATGQRPKAQVKLYTRPGCHLCDEARREMLAAGCRDLYELEEIEVDSDPELRRRYGWDIPVVTVNGALAFKHRLTRDDFRDEIRRIAPARSSHN
jgi:glutaredoxin